MLRPPRSRCLNSQRPVHALSVQCDWGIRSPSSQEYHIQSDERSQSDVVETLFVKWPENYASVKRGQIEPHTFPVSSVDETRPVLTT